MLENPNIIYLSRYFMENLSFLTQAEHVEDFKGFTREDIKESLRHYNLKLLREKYKHHLYSNDENIKCIRKTRTRRKMYSRASVKYQEVKCNIFDSVCVHELETNNNSPEISQSKYFSNCGSGTKKIEFKLFNVREIRNHDVSILPGGCKTKESLKHDSNRILSDLNGESKYFSTSVLNINHLSGTAFHGTIKTRENIVQKSHLWVPPRSPHNLLEESLWYDPWALLVATIFLNKTSCMTARPSVFWFLKENPTVYEVLYKHPKQLEKYFSNLGLQRKRAVQVWRMSHDYVYKSWRSVKELYGVGMYGEDAYRMFCLGDFNVEPKDRFLRIYKAWYEKFRK